MGWQPVDDGNAADEWEREDGYATIRIRELTDGGVAVRLDRLAQAPDGSTYRRETVPDRGTAESLAAEWREAFDLPDDDR